MTGDRFRLDVDTSLSIPSPARMYDYYLGGKDNYAVDREAAEEFIAGVPEMRALARQNRAFLQRTVRFLAAEAGIRQFLDIGTGLPTVGNVHEVAQQAAPDARVAYVDYDPVALAHARALLVADEQTITVEADVRRPEEILDDPRLRDLIDFDEPMAVLFVAVLHFVTDEGGPSGIVARFREAMARGSYVVISHAESRPEMVEAASTYDRATSKFVPRRWEEIRRLFDGFDLIEPGLVRLHEWRSDLPAQIHTWDQGWATFAGVGRKP